jgi:spore coat polysaccharide biosynthesis protein SpsF (cytidylyltransferase family)
MKNICIIQARLNSSRYPKKIVTPIYENLNALDIINRRLEKSNYLDEIIYAIPNDKQNEDLYSYIKTQGYRVSRGHPTNLVERYLSAVRDFEDCRIIRVTSDCPLVDPYWVDRAVEIARKSSSDYCSNYTPANTSKFCNGSDVEVFNKCMLTYLDKNFLSPLDKEHITFPLWDGRLPHIKHELLTPPRNEDYSDARITLDYEEDLIVLQKIMNDLQDLEASLSDIIDCYRRLDLHLINGHFRFDSGWK